MGDHTDLQKIRAASIFLTEYWPEAESPSSWKGVKVNPSGRVTVLKLAGTGSEPLLLPDLPIEVGGLAALHTLELTWCKKLRALPLTIGKLASLTTLSVVGCAFLELLPPEIGNLSAVATIELTGCKAVRVIPGTIGKLKATLKTLKLVNCSSLAALPTEIGNLGMLRTLNLSGCGSLTALPPECGMLLALTSFSLDKCEALTFPPATLHKQPVDEVVGFLAAHLVVQRTSFAAPPSKWLFERSKAVAVFLSKILTDAAHAERLGHVAAEYPAVLELTGPKGERALDLACAAVRTAMNSALLLLERFEVDAGPAVHFSSAAAVVAATDHKVAADKQGPPRRALKCMRDEMELLTELKARVGVDNGVALPVLQVYADAAVPEMAYDGKVPVERVDGLGEKLARLLRKRLVSGVGGDDGVAKSGTSANGAADSSACSCAGFQFMLVLRQPERTLADVLLHDRIAGVDMGLARSVSLEVGAKLDKLHSQKRIHADLKPLNVVRLGGSWMLANLETSCILARRFGDKAPSTAYCPPEMAKVIAIDCH